MALNTPGVQTIPQLIQTLGSQASSAINNGAKELRFDVAIKDVIGHHGVQQLVEQYCSWDGQTGTFSIDQSSVRIFPQGDQVGGAPDQRSQPSSEKSHTPRPPNAFILYRKAHHPALKEAHPNMHNNEISVILGNQWRNESEDVKQEYFRLAQDMKDQHLVNHPDYVYKPRKTSDKKRRMSRKKVAKLQKVFESLSQVAGADEIREILAITNEQNGISSFDKLAGDDNADYVLVGDLELGQNNLKSLLEDRESTLTIPGSPSSTDHAYAPLYGKLGGLSGYIAPSTAIILDDANSIINWAEHPEFAPESTHFLESQSHAVLDRNNMSRNHRLSVAEAYRQQRLHS